MGILVWDCHVHNQEACVLVFIVWILSFRMWRRITKDSNTSLPSSSALKHLLKMVITRLYCTTTQKTTIVSCMNLIFHLVAAHCQTTELLNLNLLLGLDYEVLSKIMLSDHLLPSIPSVNHNILPNIHCIASKYTISNIFCKNARYVTQRVIAGCNCQWTCVRITQIFYQLQLVCPNGIEGTQILLNRMEG
jgi:hypothetical protein